MNLVSVTRESQDRQATLVLMHGLGSDERDMIELAKQLDDRVEVICLRAPFAYGPGFAWFNIEWTAQGIEVDEAQVESSITTVSDFLAGLDAQNLLVGGFSQGAMMALGAIHSVPKKIRGGVLLSGRGVLAGTPEFSGHIFQAHGTYDEVISIGDAHALRNDLQGLSDRHEYHEYPMGHSVCDAEINDLNQWLEKALKLK